MILFETWSGRWFHSSEIEKYAQRQLLASRLDFSEDGQERHSIIEIREKSARMNVPETESDGGLSSCSETHCVVVGLELELGTRCSRPTCTYLCILGLLYEWGHSGPSEHVLPSRYTKAVYEPDVCVLPKEIRVGNMSAEHS